MSRRCELTGVGPVFGGSVSHANNRTNRKFIPNLQTKRIWVEDENRWVAAPPAVAGATAETSLVDLATPHLQHLDPHRVAAIKSALLRLQLLGRENVILTMPEVLVLD